MIKTLEFKLTLNQHQTALIDSWLEVQRYVWNRGLRMLKDFERFKHYNKHDKAYADCCPVPWEYRYIKGEDNQWVYVPYSIIKHHKKAPLSCPIPQDFKEPEIDRDSDFSLVKPFAHKHNQDKPWFLSCPFKVTQGTVKLLATSWQEYRKGKRKSPRFKRHGENKTLNDVQTGNATVIGGYIKLPKLGKVRVRSLENRWHDGAIVKTYRIKKEPSGCYLFLVGEFPDVTVKETGKTCGYDAGIVHILNDDDGNHVDIPKPLERRLKKLQRLSRQASRQTKQGKNQRKTYDRLAKLHEKIRRDRKAWHHKISTYAVRKYDAIAVENLNLQGMGRKPKPKPNEAGTGYEPNMASAKAVLNRRLKDAGIGALYSMMEAKAIQHGKIMERVPPQYTSQTCYNCGHTAKENRVDQSTFRCVNCGHTDNADTNAAKNIKRLAFGETS